MIVLADLLAWFFAIEKANSFPNLILINTTANYVRAISVWNNGENLSKISNKYHKPLNEITFIFANINQILIKAVE